MRFVKRSLSLVLILVMMCSIAVPAFALDSEWRSEFRYQFPLLSQGSTKRGYICALQSFLSAYPGASTYIANAGGIDGSYGTGTYNAVRVFQRGITADPDYFYITLTDDGITGGNTWAAIATVLGVDGDFFTYANVDVMKKDLYNDELSLYYCKNNTTTYFHTIVGDVVIQ